MTAEFKVRPVTRYVVTRFDEKIAGSSFCGEFDNENLAERAAAALQEQDERWELCGSQLHSQSQVEREFYRLNNALNGSVADPRYPEIYAAQQALAWVMDPNIARSPSNYFRNIATKEDSPPAV
jgi:hypothetical protein